MKRYPARLAFLVVAVSCSSSRDEAPPSEIVAPSAPPPAAASPETAEPQAPSAQGGTQETEEDGHHPPLFVGRFETTDPAGPRATWPGARIIARFDGTAVSARFREGTQPWMDGSPSFWEVRIDGGEWKPFAMIADDQPHDFELATGLAKGPHQVELYKRSETQTGQTQFLGFDFHGGRTLPPPARQTRRIEVLGDSQATGFGVENVDSPNTDCPGADHAGRWQNFRKAWGALLGERFDAEVHGIVFSGKGLVRNVWPTDTDHVPAYYARTNPDPVLQNSNPQLFDLQSWIPDVIVMSHASIDFSVGASYAEFRAAYRAFITGTLRARSAKTHIVMSVLGRGGRDSVPAIANELIAEGKAKGDDRLHLFVAADYEWTEMLACNGHGVPAWHKRIADALTAEIVKLTGWQ